jgi:hypothetical protein
MQMEVRNRLSTLHSRVNDHAESFFVQAQLTRDCYRALHDRSPNSWIAYLGGGCDVLRRDDQKMRRRLRVYVTNHKERFIFVDKIRWYLTFGYFAKNTVTHHPFTSLGVLL